MHLDYLMVDDSDSDEMDSLSGSTVASHKTYNPSTHTYTFHPKSECNYTLSRITDTDTIHYRVHTSFLARKSNYFHRYHKQSLSVLICAVQHTLDVLVTFACYTCV